MNIKEKSVHMLHEYVFFRYFTQTKRLSIIFKYHFQKQINKNGLTTIHVTYLQKQPENHLEHI